MKLTKLQLTNYRKFKELKLDFADGINVVIGPNEAGKSTIASALFDVLFTDPATRSHQFTDRVLPWNGARDVVLVLEFEHELTRFRLEKNFAAHTCRLTNLDSNRSAETFAQVSATLEKMLTYASPEIFTATAFIRQSELASIQTGSDLISAVQNAAGSGAKVNIQKVIEELNDQIRELKVGMDRPAKNPGQLKQAQDQITELKTELSEKRQLWEKRKHADTTAKKTGNRLEEISEKITQLELLINNHKKREELNAKLTELDTAIRNYEGKLQESEKLNSRKTQNEAQLKEFTYLHKIDPDKLARELTTISESVRITRAELEKVPAEPEAKEKQAFKTQKLLLPAGIMLAGIVVSLLLNSILPAGLAAAIAAVIFITANKGTAEADLKAEKNRLADYKAQLQKKLTEYNHSYAGLTAKYGIKNLDEFYTQKARYTALRETLTEIDGQLKGLLQGEKLESIRDKQLSLMTQKKQIEHTELTDDVKNAKLGPEDYLRKRRELDLLYLEKKRAEQTAAESKVRSEDAGVEIEQLNSLEERLASAEANSAFYQDKLKVFGHIINGLSESLKETAANSQDVVGKLVSQFLPVLTEKRYSELRLTDKLQIEVFSQEKNDWLDPVEVLSKGTVDQIYFLTRLAFIKIIYRGKQIPVILDDPFVTFDKQRRTSARKILQELSSEFQMILLTHSEEYKAWGKLINLS
jgi:uncharacterized protein YhaN